MSENARNESDEQLRDWENPNRLLQRYMTAAGAQAIGFALVALGFIVLIYGWWKISKEPIVSFQIPYLVSGGIGGVLLVGIGSVLILTHHMRLDNRRLEVVEEMVAELRDALLTEVDDYDPLEYGTSEYAVATPAVSALDSTLHGEHTGDFDLDEEGDQSEVAEAPQRVNGQARPARTPMRPRRRRLVSAGASGGPSATSNFVTVAGGTRYHLADCSSVSGKDLTFPESVDDLKPCQLCQPS